MATSHNGNNPKGANGPRAGELEDVVANFPTAQEVDEGWRRFWRKRGRDAPPPYEIVFYGRKDKRNENVVRNKDKG